MINFKSFLTEEKNTHMTHVEDQVLYGGVKGARDAILALRSLRDMLSGNSNKETDVTIKWDGAPAVFAGIDPTDGSFFVAKKGIFNANPKVYKSHEDIEADTSGDLQKKLKIAFDELSKLGITGVVQGDIMFTKNDLKTETIDGKDYITFHPNTIVYAVPVNSDEAKKIQKANIGVVFHTSYVGATFEAMKADYSVNVNKFKEVSTVWAQSADIPDLSGTVTMTKKETEAVTKELSKAGKIFHKIASKTLREMEANPDLTKMIETYNNSLTRAKVEIGDTRKHVSGLIKYISDKFEKEAGKRKTEKGKEAQYKQRDEILKFFSSSNRKSLEAVFDLQKAIIAAKKLIINKLSVLNKTSTFIKTSNGYRVTSPEGFVAIDKPSKRAVKLVDKMEFSTNNFDPNVIKGWDSVNRS